MSDEDDLNRRAAGDPEPQNYLVPLSSYSLKDWGRLLFKLKRARFTQHMRAKDIRRALGRPIWEGYFKFCFERNPWDKAISLYYWRTRNMSDRPPLYDFILANRSNGVTNYDLYSIDGEVAVDYVARYEHLDEELDYIAETLGLPAKLDLPNAKGTFRADNRHYRDVLSNRERDLIAEICAQEIDLLGYEF